MIAPAETTDAELLHRYLGGDSGAFDSLVERYQHRVYAVALRMCGEPEDARDATQDVFVSALRSLKNYREEASLGTWFHRVAINASLDLLRRRQRRPTRPLDEAVERASLAPGPEEAAITSSRAAEVHRALAALSDEHRAVLVLHDLQDLDYAAVGEALDIPLGTVKSRIHRARAELARALGHLKGGEPTGAPEPLRDGP